GDATGSANPLTVTMSSNKTITATFTALQSQEQVTGFVLVNANNEQDLQPLADGDVIALSSLPSTKLSIRANTTPASVGSVKLELSGTQSKVYIDNLAPYALHGDDGQGNYYYGNWYPPAAGTYSLKATPYSGSKATGTAGIPLTITFTISETSLSASSTAGVVGTLPGELAETALEAYPNPFSSQATLNFTLAEEGDYTLALYDARGALVTALTQGRAAAGARNTLQVEGGVLPKGLYLVRLQTATATKTLKLILDK
ncbi:hypothetical protein OB13_18450, partial [Pontibacter sp. HJ8]